jgi:pimeloyl-ACP methyl ester carboxylesterase
MKSLFIFAFLFLPLASCNIVQLSSNRIAKKLDNENIHTSQYIQDSLQINYWIGGKGPTIVFIHGFSGDAMVAWEKELKHFSKSNTVIAYDLLWFGKSYSNEVPNLSTQTAALEKLLAFFQVDSATLIGQSYGGFVALDFANKHPQMIEKMVIASSPGSTFNQAYLDTVCANFNLKSIDELFVLEEPKQIQRLFNAATYSDRHIPKFIRKQMYAAYFDQNHAQLRTLMESLPAEQANMKNLSLFKSIPTLVLWGENDEIFPLKEGEKFASAINAQFISIPKCGHAAQVDQPKKFLKILDEFIFPSPHYWGLH